MHCENKCFEFAAPVFQFDHSDFRQLPPNFPTSPGISSGIGQGIRLACQLQWHDVKQFSMVDKPRERGRGRFPQDMQRLLGRIAKRDEGNEYKGRVKRHGDREKEATVEWNQKVTSFPGWR